MKQMNKINILSPEVYNKIAAGEVVERPASIVKELVENSIDAGAKSITIEIENAGLSKIKIIDDGCGINKDDIIKAFTNHSTSKIKNAEDLNEISTLGFRGEALSSIAAVSDVYICTKTNDNNDAAEARSENGIIKKVDISSRSEGTTIEITNLFKNVPARLKFLKSERTEENEITTLVERLIFSNPNIKIKYIVNGKDKYIHSGGGLLDAIYLIYGKNVAENLIELNGETVNGITVRGYIGKPEIAKTNRTYQNIILNNRYIQNTTIAAAAEKVFENYLMHGKHPLYVLNININPEFVDVNVHPRKLEVRFTDNTKMFSAVYHKIAAAILSDTAKTAEPQQIDNAISHKTQDIVHTPSHIIPCSSKSNEIFNISSGGTQAEFKIFKETFKEKPKGDIIFKEVKEIANYKIIGRALNTYLILEKDENIILIDEHAAHERDLFNSLMQREMKQATQGLLIPYVIDANSQEATILENALSHLCELGFTISPFGKNCFKVSEVPVILDGIELKTFFEKLLREENMITSKTKTDIAREKLAKIACKSAVKSGFTLSLHEIEKLAEMAISSKTPPLCPHGRPIMIKLTRYELDKMFKRIV